MLHQDLLVLYKFIFVISNRYFLFSVFVDIDDCASHNYCNGKGVCIDLADDFTCNCEESYTGKTCEQG